MYTIKEERTMEPETFIHLISSTLYEKRWGPYFIEPVLAGMQKTPSFEKSTAQGQAKDTYHGSQVKCVWN